MILDRPTGKGAVLVSVWIILITWHAAVFAESPAVIEVGRFSAEKAINGLPTHWEPFYFKDIQRHTEYRLVEEDRQVVVKATAGASASGLTRKISIDLKVYPIVQWRWKVANVLKKSNIYRKEGDDYPARIYVVFEYDSSRLSVLEKPKYEIAKILYGEYPPLATINYVWAYDAPVGLVVPNPYTDRAVMIVVESGEKNLNAWISKERNIYADYRQAFKGEPPMVSGVAIMTDTDNTGESASAYYGDILFRKDRRTEEHR
jgi:hypothetical protein